MSISLGGIVPTSAPPPAESGPTNPVSLAQNGTVDQIASYLTANPDQRGAVETALATAGRTGDLGQIVDRAQGVVPAAVDRLNQTTNGVTSAVSADRPGSVVGDVLSGAGQTLSAVGNVVGQVVGAVTGPVATLLSGNQTPPGQGGTTQNLGQSGGQSLASGLGQTVGKTVTTVAEALRGATNVTGRVVGQVLDGAGRTTAPVVDAAGRLALISGRVVGPETQVGARPGGDLGGGAAVRDGAVRGEAIAIAAREGRLAEMLAAAAREGRLAIFLGDARAAGLLPNVIASARTLDGVLAAFAAKGGPSATELALFARAGLLSEADVRALRAAGMAIDLDLEDKTALLVPRDGPGETRLDKDGVPIDGTTAPGAGDVALAAFDAGAIRIGSRAGFESYGILGPPGSIVLAADAFEGLVVESDGDWGLVERRLGLEPGVLDDPDTLVALIDRGELSGLRLPEGRGDADGWLPGGDRAGGLPLAVADLWQETTFREVTLEREPG